MDKIEKRIRGLLATEGLTPEGLGADARRPVGRPQNTARRPVGSKARKWWATDEEYAAVRAAADRLGITVEELARRRVLGRRK